MSQQQSRILYLTVYNTLFASLWAIVLVKVIHHAPKGKTELFIATESFTRWIQTASFIEVMHAATGRLDCQCASTNALDSLLL